MKISSRHGLLRNVALLGAACVVTTTFMVAPAQASVSDPGRSAPSPVSEASWLALATGVDTANETFDGSRARAAGASAELTDEFATGWAVIGKAVTHASVDQSVVRKAADASAGARACVGKNRWDYTGLQVNVYSNSCVTTKALGVLTSGGGVASAAAAIVAATGVGAPIAGAIAAGMMIVLGQITACNASGRGIVVHTIPPMTAVWCNSQ